MSINKTKLSIALVASLAASSVVAAEQNPFVMASLDKGYMVAAADDAKMKDGKCGEGKCGAAKDKAAKAAAEKAKMKEGKCGEGKCGAAKK
jgi:uncharacterized low-complexity protein